MTGTPMVDKDYIAYLTGYDTSNMGELFNTANSDKIVTGKLPQAEQFNLFKRSDNYPFYEQYNIPGNFALPWMPPIELIAITWLSLLKIGNKDCVSAATPNTLTA